MGVNNTKKTPTYNAKLYETCQYMIQYYEQFKDYAIYKNRISLSEDNAFMDLHNCLIDSFNFLTGKSKKRTNKEWAEGSHVMAALNLEELPKEKLAMLLTIFYEYTCENHKAKNQLFNIDIEKNSLLLNTLIEKLNHDRIDSMRKIINDLKTQGELKGTMETDYRKSLDIVFNIYKTELMNDCKKKYIGYGFF